MSPLNNPKLPKAPRWIATEAGQYAWFLDEEWRRTANSALRVSDRQALLDRAEEMRRDYTVSAN